MGQDVPGWAGWHRVTRALGVGFRSGNCDGYLQIFTTSAARSAQTKPNTSTIKHTHARGWTFVWVVVGGCEKWERETRTCRLSLAHLTSVRGQIKVLKCDYLDELEFEF